MRKLIFMALMVGLASLSSGVLAGSVSVTQYTYDPGNNVKTVTDPRGLVTTYVTDGLGLRWQQNSPDSGTTNFSYDGYGRLSTSTRADGTQATFTYDGINRRTGASAGGTTLSYTYDSCTNGIGRLCVASDATGTTSYSYTPEGWIASRAFSLPGNAYALGFSYNALGQLSTVTYPDNSKATYTYSNGSVSMVQATIGGAQYNVATGITYQPGSNSMTAWTSSNGLGNSLTYDTDGRLTDINVLNVQSLNYAFDAADRIVQITNGIDSAMTQNFGYDYMSRLTWVVSSADNESFQYDANGSRLLQVLNGVSTTVTPSSTSSRIAQMAGGYNQNFGYNAYGNLVSQNGVQMYTYDGFSRLTNFTGGATVAFYVNPEGHRLSKTSPGGSTYFAPDSSGTLLAENAGSGWVDYLLLNGRLIGRISGGQLQAIHDDQTGRPEAITDASKSVVWRARNFAFDRSIVTNNTAPLNIGFPGQYFDGETGLWSNGARHYCAVCGWYVESDPVGLQGGINTYAYVGGSPLSNVDPLGLAPPGNSGERGWSGGAGGTNNPSKHWKDDPANPGWGWQKNPQTGKKTYKKRPPYVCPPTDEGGNQKMDPFEDALQQHYPSSYAPSPATQTITVGGVLLIVAMILLAPVGA